MIRIKLPNGEVIQLSQLTDYIEEEKRHNFEYEEIPTGGIMRDISRYFLRKRELGIERHFAPISSRTYQSTLISVKKTNSANEKAFMKKEKKSLTRVYHESLYDYIDNREKKKLNNKDLLIGQEPDVSLISHKGGPSNYQFIDRFPDIPSVSYDDYCKGRISHEDWVHFQEVPEFRGTFHHLVHLNSFDYWDVVEDEIRDEGFLPKRFSVKEMVIWELLRHSSGDRHYTTFGTRAKTWDKLYLQDLFENPTNIPRSHHFSHTYSILKAEHFKAFFLSLVEECIQYKIIIPRIIVADGVFHRTLAGNFTKDKNGNPTDPEASRTVHGRKFYGKGYTTIVFFAWCRTRWLPVWAKTYTGSISENRVYQEVVEQFLRDLPYDWRVIAYDRGADSRKNREFNKKHGLLGIIPVRKNIKYDEILKIGKRGYFCSSDIPECMSKEKFGRLYDHRAQAEAGFSSLDSVFSMKTMNSMGLNAAAIHIYEYLILLLLHALTAYKVNRSDLVMSARAFTTLLP